MLEGDLTPESLHSFESWLKEHPEKSKEMDIFRHTKLLPEKQLVLKNRQRLYHSTRQLRITPSFLIKIAALFILVMILPVISEKNTNVPLQETENPAFSSVFQNHTENIPESNPANSTAYASAGQSTTNRPDILPVKAVEKLTEKDLVTEVPTLLAATSRVDLPSLLPSESKSDPYLVKNGDPQLMFSSAALDMLVQNDPEETYLSDKLARKIGLSGLNMGKVVRWGLTMASGLSKGKFNYDTSESGDIIALNLDTRLLGFSIPVNEK
jgi:hypothetical protein